MDRRSLLSSAAVVGVGALSACATPGTASGAKTVFAVAQPMLPIAGTSEMFPVRRIYCIGRNYAAHAREMGSDPTREPPFFFQKPSDAIQFVAPGTTADHPYPPLTKNYHYEIELVAALQLMPGDIIFSGTPENVGPVIKGDVMDGLIAGLPGLSVKVV